MSGSGTGYDIKPLNLKDAKVHHVTVQPGITIPAHQHPAAYIVHPYTAMTIVRTTYEAGKMVNQETVSAKAGEPYHVPATLPNQEITVENTTGGIIVFGKHHLPIKKHHDPESN